MARIPINEVLAQKYGKDIKQKLSENGRKGGKSGSREDKSRAGKLGFQAMLEKKMREMNEVQE